MWTVEMGFVCFVSVLFAAAVGLDLFLTHKNCGITTFKAESLIILLCSLKVSCLNLSTQPCLLMSIIRGSLHALHICSLRLWSEMLRRE